jgi:cytochrome c-type biogenesis protein
MTTDVPVAFLAGLLSIITPCVLPLVPGYLSAVSAVEVDRLGEPRVGWRVARASVPFLLGFTVVFVALGASAAALGGILPQERRIEVAGFLLVVFGLAFAGLLPWPERLLAPRFVEHARERGSSALLGAAFAVCAAPCVGAVLGSVPVFASASGTVARGIALLTAYSLGLALAFLLVGLLLVRPFRALRSHWTYVRAVSGGILVVFGLLLFFHREWWLYTGLRRVLDAVGLGDV